ncbi:MAG: S9 family peptidase [Marinilabiliales bacterium]
MQLFAFTQEKELTIQDAVIGQWTNLYPEYLKRLRWKADADEFSYVKDNTLYLNGPNYKSEKAFIKLDDINNILISEKIEKLNYFPDYQWEEKDIISLSTDSIYVIMNLKSKSIVGKILIEKNAENLDFNYKAKKLAYTIDNNLHLADIKGKVIKITDDSEKNIVNGQTVSRNEFGISKGIFWSPNGNYIAYYQKDESKVTDYPLVDINNKIAKVKNIKYPMAGMDSENIKVFVYNVNTGEKTELQTGEKNEQYQTNIAWSPDEKSLYIAELNRAQNHMQLKKYNVTDGKLEKILFEEKNERYVEPEHPALFVPGKNDLFIWQSERDHWDHLYLFNTDGKLIRQLTNGNYVVTSVLGFDPSGTYLFYTSTQESPIENHIYKVNISTGESMKLSKESGTHNALMSYSGKYLIDQYSSRKIPSIYDLIDSNGNRVKNLVNAENPLKDYKLGEMDIGTIKAADGVTDLYYRLIKPVDFDPNKKYPAIIYVYGGPHAQLITESWLGGVRLWQYYMAQKGYVMLTVDSRGSANRGFDFESIIHRNLGVVEVEDQMKGVEFLKSLGYVDENRIGVHGWSYGGFMTTSLMLKHNDVFKVAVAGGPVMDWKYYEVMYGERYMDTPEENPEGYKNACLTTKTDLLKGKLLIIHGYLDNTVVPQHSLEFLQNCIDNNKQVDFFFYPNAEHNVIGYNRVHLMEKVSQYFDDYLK